MATKPIKPNQNTRSEPSDTQVRIQRFPMQSGA